MNKTLLKLSAAIIFLLSGISGANAQSGFASLKVYITNDSAKGINGVNIIMEKGGIEVASDATNSDGYASFSTLAPGVYNIIVTLDTFRHVERDWELQAGTNNQDFTLTIGKGKAAVGKIGAVEIKVKPRKDPINIIGSSTSVSGSILLGSGARGYDGLIKTSSAILSTPQGTSVRGVRSDGNGTFIDGQRVIGGGGVGSLATEAVSAFIGGIPAQYGDLTGGAFSSTTRTATERLVTSVEAISSTGLDPFSYNTVEGFVSGPLWVKKYKDEQGKTRKLVKLGFILDGTLGYYKDPSPTRTGVYVVNDAKLSELEKNPLQVTPNGFVNSAAYLRENDFTHLKARPNSALGTGNFLGKLEYRPNKYVNVVGSASYYYSRGLSVTNSIMNYKAAPRVDANTFRTYLQFTQNFKVSKESTIKNAFYTIRADYQNSYSETRDANHLDNIFNYGYIGTFKRYPTEVFQYSYYDQDPNREPRKVIDQYGNEVTIRNYWELAGYADTAMTFERSDLNPLRANYTQNVYDNAQFYPMLGGRVNNQTELQNAQGLLNGFNPSSIYSLWPVAGTVTSNWSKSQTERYALFVMGQMQVKPKTIGGRERAPHDLQAGFFYEQQISRGYSLNANGLWVLMNQLMNSHILDLDKDHPILSYDADGVFTDTVRYNRLVNWSAQSHFDRSFRNKLIEQGSTDVYGKPVDDRTFVDINSYQPGDFSLDMFNADELLNNGNGYVSYFGYDHLGRTVRGKPSISEFLDNKDKRIIGAFQPVYIAAWLQDEFQFKDLVFRIGLRMERYDANQQVLRDPYSLYPIKTAAEVKQINGLDVNHPNNIGDDFKVYVNDISSPTKIIGYRDGDRWYNADGSEQKSPEFLANQTQSGRIAPYLVDPNQQDLTSAALTDYTPIVNLLPRIWFSFPLEPGKKTFYVSYDVLAQRPNSGASFLTIDELYYLKNRQGATISNGSLQARVKTDYEVGYKQIFGRKRNRGLELAASYSEIRKDFGLYQINNGYPVTYVTYRNIDFSTITGFRANLILQGIGRNDNGPLTLQTSYMLQFADGTGSNINSQATLIASNQPNLRNVIPLGELDIRHNMKVSATWAWFGGKDPVSRRNLYTGPVVGGKEIFKFASFNIIGNAYSGTPYTPTTQAVQIGAVQRAQIKGVPFGARLPWQYTLDMNITKGFALRRENKDNPLQFNVFLWVQNVLNTKNIISVFPYTGQPQDDGFLTSSNGQQTIATQVNSQSYVDLYRVLLNSQTGNYGSPRQIRLGVRVNFN